MKIFKESKNQPIKLRGFKYIEFDENHPNICYYYKALDRNNFELMTCHLEGNRKPELGAGTNITVLDCFMSNYLENRKEQGVDIITDTINKTFYDYEEKDRTAMIEKYNSEIPKELKELFNNETSCDYELLYCSNDEAEDRKLGIVNMVFVKEEHIKSDDERIGIDKHYTIFKPMKFMTSPSYLKDKKGFKYIEVPLNEIVVDNDLLI